MTTQAEQLVEEVGAAYVYEEPVVTYVYEECSPRVEQMMVEALKKMEAIDARRRKEAEAAFGQK